MIATKVKKQFKCSSCGMIHPKHLGLCRGCAKFGTIQETVLEPKKYSIPKVSEKRKAENALNKNIHSDLDKWFDFQIKYELDNGECKCQNCHCSVRNNLNSKDNWIRRGSIAHVIFKAKWASVATHIHNFMILCLDCHKKYDSSYETAMQMPVFQIAKTKFKLFKSAIKEPLGKLPEELIN